VVDTRSQFLRNQAINRANTVRENRAIADRNNDLQYAMSRSPEFYQDPKNRASVKGVLERTPAVTTDQNESRNMYQMLMNQMKGGDSGARLIDTRGLPTGAYRTGRTLFTDPAKSQGFLRDVGSLFTGKNQAAVRAPEYSPFPNAGFGEKYYKDTFGKFDFGGLMEGIAKIASPLKYLPKRDRVPLDRDPDFLPENNPFPIEYDKIEPYVEEEPITFLPQDAYKGSGMETNPFYNPNLRSSGSPFDTMDITNDIVGDGPDIAEAYELQKDKLSKEEPSKYPLGNIGSIFEGEDYSPDFDNFITTIQDPVSREAAKNAALAFQMYYNESSKNKFDSKFEELYQAYIDAIIQGRLVDSGIVEPR
tara:strand:- start:370 stop:1455 length:1086 start_codon:yes stop_codon:yes gene_type:complete